LGVVHPAQGHPDSAARRPKGWEIPYEFASVGETHPTPRSIRLAQLYPFGGGSKSCEGNRIVKQRVGASLERVWIHEKAMHYERREHLAGL